MDDTARISRAPPQRTSQNYAALREEGMALILQLAAATWTDHNPHDPGITLLEALAYAMTELGLRIEQNIADLLRSGETHAPPDLPPAHRVLPSGPVTIDDLRRLLLDHPLIGDALITPVAAGNGLFEVLLAFENTTLNSNIYTLAVDVGGETYTLDFAMPHWDEAEAAPFRDSAGIDNITMPDPGSGVWRPLEESQSYFGELQVDYSGPGGPGNITLWTVLLIADPLNQPALEAPAILAAARSAVETTGAGSLAAMFVTRVQAAHAAVQQVRRYLANWRNLGEEPARISVARVQDIAVRARIEVTGSTDLEQLLARIFLAIDQALSPPLRFLSLAQMRARGKSVEAVFDGPLPGHGFLDEAQAESLARAGVIYVSDVLRLIMRQRSAAGTDLVAQENPTGRDIVAVSALALSNFINNRPITTDAVGCLRLVEIERFRPRLSLAKSWIVLVRDDVEVGYDHARVEALFQQMQQQARAAALPDDPSPQWPVPRGESLPVEDYYPFQNDLPRLYGVGETGLPSSASTERKARSLQAQGYLLLFEQYLADLTAQLGHINHFFSPDSQVATTYFTRALLALSNMDKLLLRFQPGGDWPAFAADRQNPYRRALQAAAEDRERFLDRRNRMLDHLLARQGQEMVAWGQELHRWAQQELALANLLPAQLIAQMAGRRQAANARLIQDKAAFLAATPELTSFRLQAFGNPLQRRPGMLRIEHQDPNYRWVLAPDDDPLLQAGGDSVGFFTHADTVIAASEAVVLAAQPAFYEVVSVSGGRHRYRLRDESGGGRIVGESVQSWTTVSAAQNALQATAERFATLRMELSLTPMEQRVAHLTGIRSRLRRRLIVPLDAFFEIYDEVDNDGNLEKRWRLWELPGYTGRVLLSSVFHFQAPTDTEAVAQAEASIAEVLRYGMDEWNYRRSPAGPDTFNIELLDPAGNTLALRNPPLPTADEVEQTIAGIVNHLNRDYSGEGLHLVEHLLLRPRAAGDPELSLPGGEPYGPCLSLVFPSGHARDHSLDPATAPRRPSTPHRFRDPEFRRHAERMVRQSCPAHLLPAIYWVDREAPGTPASPGGFEIFEQRYLTWLDSLLIPGASAAAVTGARADLIESLNAIVQG